MHSQDRSEDTKKAAATVASGDEQGEASSLSENDDDAVRAPWRRGLRMSPKAGARNEARSAQLFLPFSDIAWYIAGVLYSRAATSHLSWQECYIAGVLHSRLSYSMNAT